MNWIELAWHDISRWEKKTIGQKCIGEGGRKNLEKEEEEEEKEAALITHQCPRLYSNIAPFTFLRYCHCQSCCRCSVTAHEHGPGCHGSSSAQQLTLRIRGRMCSILTWLHLDISRKVFLLLYFMAMVVKERMSTLSLSSLRCQTLIYMYIYKHTHTISLSHKCTLIYTHTHAHMYSLIHTVRKLRRCKTFGKRKSRSAYIGSNARK